MDLITIIIVALGIGLALVYTLVDDAFEKLVDWLFRVLGLRSGTGPLAIKVTTESDRIVLALENQGKHKIMLTCVEGCDGNMKRIFPMPYLNGDDINDPSIEEMARKKFFKISISQGQFISLILNKSELVSLDCQTLAILDTEGKTWPVDGFHLNNIIT